MVNKEHCKKLNYFGYAMFFNKYIDDYIFGITENNRDKIEFIYKGLDCRVVYIPTKGFQCYVNNEDIGIFSNYEKFKNFVDKFIL